MVQRWPDFTTRYLTEIEFELRSVCIENHSIQLPLLSFSTKMGIVGNEGGGEKFKLN